MQTHVAWPFALPPCGLLPAARAAWIAFDALAFGSRRDRFAHPQKGGRPGLLLQLLPAAAAASCRYPPPLPATCWAARGRGSAIAELPGCLAAWLPGLRGLAARPPGCRHCGHRRGKPACRAWLPALRATELAAGEPVRAWLTAWPQSQRAPLRLRRGRPSGRVAAATKVA